MSGANSERWQTTGLTVTPHQPKDAPPLHLARSLDDDPPRFAFLRQIGRDWKHHGPVVTLAEALRTAENVAAGNPRALTWPHAMLAMATGLIALEGILRGEIALPSDGGAESVGGVGVHVDPPVAAPAAAHNPTAGAVASCTTCGD